MTLKEGIKEYKKLNKNFEFPITRITDEIMFRGYCIRFGADIDNYGSATNCLEFIERVKYEIAKSKLSTTEKESLYNQLLKTHKLLVQIIQRDRHAKKKWGKKKNRKF